MLKSMPPSFLDESSLANTTKITLTLLYKIFVLDLYQLDGT